MEKEFEDETNFTTDEYRGEKARNPTQVDIGDTYIFQRPYLLLKR